MLVVLPVLVANGLVLLFALRTYAADVAAVVESSSARSRGRGGRKSA
jgi:hypothetical protein